MSDNHSAELDIRNVSRAETSWEDKESVKRRDFEALRATYDHYMGNAIAQVVGWGELFLTHPKYPQNERSQEFAQIIDASIREIMVTHGVLSAVFYDGKIKKFGGRIIFDLDGEIQRRLNPEAEASQPSSPQDLGDAEIPDRFTIYQNTIGHYLGNALAEPRGYFELMKKELTGIPEIQKEIQQTNAGIQRATAVKDLISNLSKDAEKTSDTVKAWYKLNLL